MHDLVDEYRNLLAISRQLLESAQSKNWDRADELELNRTVLLRKIQVLPDITTLGLEIYEQLEIAKLIEDILRCDAQSAPLVTAEMVDLRELMDSVANERRLGQSYL